MDDMNENKFKQLKATLCGGNEKNDHRYYVYGLFVEDNPYPFYIGKGQGARVFQHEEECDKIIQSINNGLDEDVLDVETSDKLKTILKNNGNITKVIIKWGLTNDEAYMCESALINLYKYMAETETSKKLQLEELTNAVNGHASDIEKTNKAGETKARTIQSFLDECALEEFDISTEAKESPLDKALVIFIRINRLYQSGMSDEELREITRGCWNISDLIYKYIKHPASTKSIYIAGIYQQIVKCVYKVTDIISAQDFKKGNTKKPQKADYIKRKGKETELEIEWLEYESEDFATFKEKISKYDKSILDNYFNGKDWEKHYEQWQNRKYFIVDKSEDKITGELLNKLITCTNDPSYLSGAQNPISRNFDIKICSKNKENPYEISIRDKRWFLTNHITKKLLGTKGNEMDLRKRKEDFLNDLVNKSKLSRLDKRTDNAFSLRECLSKDDTKEFATKDNKYYKLNELLTAEDFDKQYDNKFPETAKKESKQKKNNS